MLNQINQQPGGYRRRNPQTENTPESVEEIRGNGKDTGDEESGYGEDTRECRRKYTERYRLPASFESCRGKFIKRTSVKTLSI